MTYTNQRFKGGVKMNETIKVLMDRDGMKEDEATQYFNEMQEEIMGIISSGGEYWEVEEYLLSEGFEMDYLFDFI